MPFPDPPVNPSKVTLALEHGLGQVGVSGSEEVGVGPTGGGAQGME